MCQEPIQPELRCQSSPLPKEGAILVVEDDTDVREALQQMLEVEGHFTIAAQNGKEALEALVRLEKNGGGGSPVCLILLDLTMPVMDGAQFLKAKRTLPAISGIPVLVLTAKEEGLAGLTDQVQNVLRKPVDFDHLIEQVRRFCLPSRGY